MTQLKKALEEIYGKPRLYVTMAEARAGTKATKIAKQTGRPYVDVLREQLLAQQEERAHPARCVIFGAARYVGGHADFPNPRSGTLFVGPTSIGIRKAAVVPFAEVASVEIAGETVAKSKVAATLAFGVVGGLASKGARNEVAFLVRTKWGATVTYVLPDSKDGPIVIRAKVGQVLREAGIPLTDGVVPMATEAVDIADQLRKFAALRDEGLLTDDEFAAQKAKLLAAE
jgi:hypothetical protein